VKATLADAELARFAQESLPGRQNLKGTMLANLEVHGTAPGTNLMSGTGGVYLRDADIGELPQMMQLLKVLRVRAPDATAFNRSDMEFRLQGEHLYFDKLDFLGDAVSLYGKGELDFKKNVKLWFHTTLGQNNLPVPLLKKVVGEASGQILQIRMAGTLDDPKITNEVFPGINEAIGQLQLELGGHGKAPPINFDPLRILPTSNAMKATKE
jgi:hypothetical protein